VLLVLVLMIGLGAVALGGATAGQLTVDERRLRMVAALAIIGALVIGFGVILFFAANWDEIARPLRVALLLVGEAAFFGAGFYLTEVRRAYLHVGHAFVFLGVLLFGASIFLVGQMYHVQAHDPLGFLLWSAGALAVAVLVRSGPIAALAIITFLAWTIHELISLDEVSDQDLARVLPVLFILAGSALYGLGTGLSPRLEALRFVRPMRMLGYATLALGIFALTFRFLFEEAEFDSRGQATNLAVVKVLLWAFAVAAVAGAASIGLRLQSRRTAIYEALTLGAVSILGLIAVYATGSATGYALLFNAALAVVALGAIVAGLINDEVWLANGGIVWVAIDVIARFLDPEWSMLQRATVFLLAGTAILLGAAFLERRRSSITVPP
jgi:uncharacterized membrane protein